MTQSNVRAAFERHFNTHGTLYASAGRINLIGEHTDYNGGFVFPGAVDCGITAMIRPNGTDRVRAYAVDLDSYAEFEAAGVEGENLRQAKGRIESTMDAIVRGFEHQLDELYKADALDVDSDIRVMETMLRRDTATVEEDFGLGAAAQKKEKS